MDETRTTHTITTPVANIAVVLVDELLGDDIEAIEMGPMHGAKMGLDMTGDSPKPDFQVDPATMYKAQQDALIARVVVSIDGSSEDIRGRLGKMKAADYRFVMKEVKVIADGGKALPVEKKSA